MCIAKQQIKRVQHISRRSYFSVIYLLHVSCSDGKRTETLEHGNILLQSVISLPEESQKLGNLINTAQIAQTVVGGMLN